MFRFSIRDVLWLTVVVAIGAQWWVDWRQVRFLRHALHVSDEKLFQTKDSEDLAWQSNAQLRKEVYNLKVALEKQSSAPNP